MRGAPAHGRSAKLERRLVNVLNIRRGSVPSVRSVLKQPLTCVARQTLTVPYARALVNGWSWQWSGHSAREKSNDR